MSKTGVLAVIYNILEQIRQTEMIPFLWGREKKSTYKVTWVFRGRRICVAMVWVAGESEWKWVAKEERNWKRLGEEEEEIRVVIYLEHTSCQA